jgi:hypothetical protein
MKTKGDGVFLRQLEKNIADILAQHDVSIDQRLKAIECGSKLLLIRHRITGAAGEGEDGKYFSSKAG